MSRSKTSYHFEITTSDAIMEVFGTVMSYTPEGIVLDIWCPEEPRLNHRITTKNDNNPQTIEALLHEDLKQMNLTENNYLIHCLSY